MDNIVTFKELQEISGYKIASKIRQWLQNNHIPFILSRNAHPLVDRNALAYKMGAPTVVTKETKIKNTEPNYGAMVNGKK